MVLLLRMALYIFGVSVKAVDANGNVFINEEDLMGEQGMKYTDLKRQLAPNVIFTGSGINNPITCEFSIWDKKSEGHIKATVALNIN